MRNTIRLGKIFGIEIGLDASWLLIFILITWSLADHYLMVQSEWTPALRWGLAAATSLLFFASVLAHELAHSLVSKAQGIDVPRITLFIFGGAAELSAEPRRARDEFWMALVGPLTSLALAALFGAVWFVTREANLLVNAVTGWLASINLALGLFNLLPGFPLDGGRIVRAVVWGVSQNLQLATSLAVMGGVLVSWGLIFYGLVQVFGGNWADGLWMAFIGWFLQGAAVQEGRGVVVIDLLKGHTAREVLMTDCPHVMQQLSLDVFVENVAIPSGRRCFPVMDGEKFLGLLTLHRIQDVPAKQWRTTHVAEVMIPPDQLVKARPDEELTEVVEAMERADVNQVPVMENGQFLGMVTRANLLAFLRAQTAKQATAQKLQ
jgi:Zn-dependent protease